MNVIDLETGIARGVTDDLEIRVLQARIVENLHRGLVASQDNPLVLCGLDDWRFPWFQSQMTAKGDTRGISSEDSCDGEDEERGPDQ